MSPRRAATVLGLLAAAGLACAAWLFLPRAAEGAVERPRLSAVLVDVSASVARSAAWLGWARGELRELAEEAQAAGEDLAVLAYADGVATAFAPGAPGAFLDELAGRSRAPFDPRAGLGQGATRLAAALCAAEPLVRGGARPPGRLTLLAPRTYTGESPAGVLARLRRSGVELETRAPPPAEASDLGLLELGLAPRVEPGAPLVALARLCLTRGSTPAGRGGGPASLEIEVLGDGPARTVTRAVPLPDRDGTFELPVDCGASGFGRTELSARCRLGGGPDLFPENDRARASTLAEGARAIGVVVAGELAPAAHAWLASGGSSRLAGLQFVFLPPADVARHIPELSALVSFDLAPGDLPEPLVESFVRSGGGWLALSGWRFLNDWIPGQCDGPLHRLLPCEPGRAEVAPRDVVLLVDGSGSMEGAPFETVRAAALELVAAALPSDRVTLRFFTTRLEPEHVLKARALSRAEDSEEARRAARELFALRVPLGMTYLLSSLRELRGAAPGTETLALLLTDGIERDVLPDPLGLAAEVAAELARERVRLVVIAVGDADLPLLAALAGGVERVLRGESLEDLQAIFRRELFGAQVAAGEIALHWAARASGSLADEVASAAAGTPELGSIERHVRNRLRPQAEALWESAAGEPVLALARAGLGRTALFASRPTDDWAGRFTRAGLGQPAEFEGLLRWLARGGGAPGPRARIEGGRLSVSGLSPETPAELRARLIDLDARGAPGSELFLLPPAGLGRDLLGTREVRLPAVELGQPALVLPGDGGAELALAVERAPAQEFARAELDVPEGWLASENEVERDEARRSSHRAAPWALALGLSALLAAALSAAAGQGAGHSSR